MEVINKGHVYKLNNNKSPGHTILTFFKDEEINGEGFDGRQICAWRRRYN